MTENEKEFLKALTCLSRKYGVNIIGREMFIAEMFEYEKTTLAAYTTDEDGYKLEWNY